MRFGSAALVYAATIVALSTDASAKKHPEANKVTEPEKSGAEDGAYWSRFLADSQSLPSSPPSPPPSSPPEVCLVAVSHCYCYC
jgi:hypothetical protein